MILLVAIFSYIVGIFFISSSWFFVLLLIIPLAIILKTKGSKRTLFLIVTLSCFSLSLLRQVISIRNNLDYINQIGFVSKAEENYTIIKTFKGSVYLSKGGFEIGDILRIEGQTKALSFSHYENSFDFEGYLNRRFVFCEISLDRSFHIFKSPIRINAFKSFCLRPFSGDVKTLISSFIFGDSPSALGESRVIRQLGVLRMLSTSGLHISFFLHYIDQKLSKTRFKEAYPYIELSYLLAMTILTSYKFALVRISIDRLLKLILMRGGIKLLPLPRAAVSSFMMLIINPNYLFESSFLFTYIILFALSINPLSFKKGKRFLSFVFCSSLVLPLSSSLEFGFNPLSIFFGYFLSSLLITYFLISHLVLFGPGISAVLKYPFGLLIHLLDYFDQLDVFIVTGKVSVAVLLIIYSASFIAAYFYSLRDKRKAKACLAFSLIVFLFPVLPIDIVRDSITFIDVDQGDSTLFRIRGKSYLIDTGGLRYVDLATMSLIKYFHKEKVSSLEAVFITHRDYDHYGALESLKNNYKIGSVYYNDVLSYEGDGFSLTNLNTYKISSEENDLSAVFLLETERKKILLMGDAPKAVERKIMNDYPQLDVDVLKLGHHGSNTSSDFNFLRSVNPEIAIISCGKDNRYHHPNDEVIKSLEALSIDYYRTDLDGTIKLSL